MTGIDLVLLVFPVVLASTPVACWLIHDYYFMPRWARQEVRDHWETFYASLQVEL